MKKKYLVKQFLIFLFFLKISFLLAQSVLALTLSSPETIKLNEVFFASINGESESNQDYDVKLYVHNSPDQKISRVEYVSEIYDSDWKDSWYYLQEAFPMKKTYELRVIGVAGDMKLCLKLRKSSTNSDSLNEICNEITVLDSTSTESSQEVLTFDSSQVQSNAESNDKIMLNSKTDHNPTPNYILTQKGKTKDSIIYSFLAFCAIIIILLALRRL